MRTLVFGTTDQDRENFHVLYLGFLMGTPDGGLRGIAANRLAMKVLDKFEEIAKKDDEYQIGDNRRITPNGDMLLELGKDGGEILLEEREYEMLARHVDNAPWLPGAARKVISAMEFLEETKE